MDKTRSMRERSISRALKSLPTISVATSRECQATVIVRADPTTTRSTMSAAKR